MASELFLRRFRKQYARLLRFYPKPYRERFGEAMEQTVNDLCRERIKAKRGLLSFALCTFVETSAAIIRENATSILKCSMKRGATILFKITISLIVVTAVAVWTFGLPAIAGFFLVWAYLLSIPFFVGLYQVFKLLNYFDANKAYSGLSAGALRHIKYAAIAISAWMVAGIGGLMVLSRGKGEDITGIVAPALLVTIVSSAVATVAAVLQKRVQKAIDLKPENDLPV